MPTAHGQVRDDPNSREFTPSGAFADAGHRKGLDAQLFTVAEHMKLDLSSRAELLGGVTYDVSPKNRGELRNPRAPLALTNAIAFYSTAGVILCGDIGSTRFTIDISI